MAKYRLRIPREAYNKVISATTTKVYANTGAYVLLHFRDARVDFIIYDNTKNEPYRAIYSGDVLPAYLKPFVIEVISEKPSAPNTMINALPQIGSDEVGFGDFFGPLVVVSALVTKDNREYLLNLGITDSKKLSDEKIIMLGHELVGKIAHTKNIVTNPKYNELIANGYNMNKIKAMLHQNVLTTLARKTNYDGMLYVDKFTNETKFREYTLGMAAAPIVLVAHGEVSSLAIATASVLARYYFLLEMALLNKHYNTVIPLGAGANVDAFVQEFIKEKGLSALKLITKHNFRNFKDLGVV